MFNLISQHNYSLKREIRSRNKLNTFFSLEFRYLNANIAISRALIAKKTSNSSVNWYEKASKPKFQHDFDPKLEIQC
jgi:hypothetical protein